MCYEQDSEEEDSILGSVLAEIGVELDNKMMGASTAPMQACPPAPHPFCSTPSLVLLTTTAPDAAVLPSPATFH